MLECSTTKNVSMPKRADFGICRQELSLDISVGVHILVVVEQSSFESQPRGYAKTLILLTEVVNCRSKFLIQHLHTTHNDY